jgi:hypothetical protein
MRLHKSHNFLLPVFAAVRQNIGLETRAVMGSSRLVRNAQIGLWRVTS